MTRHLLRLIWNRKRHNLLLSIEIFFSFVVLLAVTVGLVNVAANYGQPLGYRIDNIWRIQVMTPGFADKDTQSPAPAILKNIFATLRGLPGVEGAAGVMIPPYSGHDSSRTHGEVGVHLGQNGATDELADLLGLQVVAGRWFTPEDSTMTNGARAVVINERLATRLFGDGDAIGQILPLKFRPNVDGRVPPAERVVGVITDYRKGGELSTPQNYLFTRLNLDLAGQDYQGFPNHILVRVAPGTTADFEETILKALNPLARDWAFAVDSLAADRESSFDSYKAAILVASIVTGFLLLMVALGLIGVVWQMVTERTREFGLRRAKGAPAVSVQRQVLTELVLIATLAIAPGVLLASQVPLLPMPNDWVIPDNIFLLSLLIAAVGIYAVVLLCGWYPSRLATRVQPAEALHYE
jgi:putative ABC transport system permease protein